MKIINGKVCLEDSKIELFTLLISTLFSDYALILNSYQINKNTICLGGDKIFYRHIVYVLRYYTLYEYFNITFFDNNICQIQIKAKYFAKRNLERMLALIKLKRKV